MSVSPSNNHVTVQRILISLAEVQSAQTEENVKISPDYFKILFPNSDDKIRQFIKCNDKLFLCFCSPEVTSSAIQLQDKTYQQMRKSIPGSLKIKSFEYTKKHIASSIIVNLSKTKSIQGYHHHYLELQNLVRHCILQQKNYCIINQKDTFKCPNKNFEVAILSIKTSKLLKGAFFDHSTKIKLRSEEAGEFLVRDASIDSSKSRVIFTIQSNENLNDVIHLNKNEILSKIRPILRPKLSTCFKDSLTIQMHEKTFSLTLKSVSLNHKRYDFHRHENSFTRFEKMCDAILDVSSHDKKIILKEDASSYTSILDYCTSQGIVGLTKDFEDTFSYYAFSRVKELEHQAKKRHIEPEKGILLYGPPGTGKTQLALAFSRFLNIPEQNIKKVNATELIHPNVGKTEAQIRDLWNDAKESYQKTSADKGQAEQFLIIIDEIDAIARKRSLAKNSWEQTQVNQLLMEMDGIHSTPNALVIGITNRIEDIDPALLRSGRFGIKYLMGYPNSEQREAILDFYLSPFFEQKLVDDTVDISELVQLTNKYTGADIRGMVKQANLRSFTRIHKLLSLNAIQPSEIAQHPSAKITQDDLEYALSVIKQNKTNRSTK